MKVSEKFSKITSYQSDNFKKYFGDMEFEDKKTKLYSKVLERYMTDKQILVEFKPTELTLGEVFNYLKKADKSDWMIFYCKDKSAVLWALYVRWCSGGWDVRADSVEGPDGWRGGRRVFSRKPLETLDTNTLTLESSDPSLEKAIEIVKKEGYKIFKEI